MRSKHGTLSADWLVAFLAEIFKGLVVEGAVFILLVHVRFEQ